MTGKADFTAEEWTLVSEGPTGAGMVVITASGGGTFRESFSMAKAYSEARTEHGASELLDEIVSAKPEVDRSRHASAEELRSASLERLREAVGVLERKASPEEVGDYRRFVLTLANRVAEAHKEHGERVSEEEQRAIEEIRTALGAAA
jgi:hypothetical protein